MCRTIHLGIASAGAAAGTESVAGTPPTTKTDGSVSVQAYPRDWRRRSADVGGLHLALAAGGAATGIDANDAASASGRDSCARETINGSEAGAFSAQGTGWMGGEPGDQQTMYAELLSDMYTETNNSVTENNSNAVPPKTSEAMRTRLIHSLSRWHFEPHLLDEEEVLGCTLILFECLFRIEGMEETIPVSMQQITAFIYHLRRIYRFENTYHNFEHALDVLQATHSYLRSAGVVPEPKFLFQPEHAKWTPKKRFNSGSLIATLGLRELFMLYVAAIGHDVGHPGFNNHFMKNAQAPLSLIYHLSPLEQMHCQLLLRVMRHHGLGVLLDDPQHGGHCRKVLQQSVLATDMSVHDDFMATLKGIVEGQQAPLCTRQVVMCQAILKNADISNPTRPFLVSKHWASALMQEWFGQASLEEEYGVNKSVYPSSNPADEANGQIFFISRYAKPLLELTERAVPEMRMYVTHCRSNLKEWNRRKKALKSQEKEIPSSPALTSSSSSSNTSIPPRMFQCYHSAFRLALPTLQPPPSSDPSSSSSTNGAKSERDQDSVPGSPSETESVSSSAVFSPISETSSSNRFPSNGSNVSTTALSNGTGTGSPSLLGVPAPHAAIRAASKVGSLRKKSQTNLNNEAGISNRKGVRNSWCASSGDGGFSAFFQTQTQLQMNTNGISNGAANGTTTTTTTTMLNPPPLSAPPNMIGKTPAPIMTTMPPLARPVKIQVSP